MGDHNQHWGWLTEAPRNIEGLGRRTTKQRYWGQGRGQLPLWWKRYGGDGGCVHQPVCNQSSCQCISGQGWKCLRYNCSSSSCLTSFHSWCLRRLPFAGCLLTVNGDTFSGLDLFFEQVMHYLLNCSICDQPTHRGEPQYRMSYMLNLCSNSPSITYSWLIHFYV
jgi:hypothetical protein